MKVGSFKLAIIIFLYIMMMDLVATVSGCLGDFGLELGRIIGLSWFLFFYFFYGVSHKIFPDLYNYACNYTLEQWLIMPFGYAIITYLIDRFCLTRVTQRLWLRVPILLIIFAAMSIYAFWLFPPFGK